MVAWISVVSSERPRQAARMSWAWSKGTVPVAAAIAVCSAARENSPESTSMTDWTRSAAGSVASAPASRASRTWQAASAWTISSSKTDIAVRLASHSQRRLSLSFTA